MSIEERADDYRFDCGNLEPIASAHISQSAYTSEEVVRLMVEFAKEEMAELLEALVNLYNKYKCLEGNGNLLENSALRKALNAIKKHRND